MSVPTAVTNLQAVSWSQAGEVRLTWDQPASPVAVSGYRISVTNTVDNSPFDVILTGSGTDRVLGTSDGLFAGASYSFTVFPITGVLTMSGGASGAEGNGVGPVFATATGVNQIPDNTPNAPTLTATAGTGAGQINLTWTTPSNSATVVVSGYTIEYTNLSTTTVTTLPIANTTTNLGIGLTAGTSYSFRVRARAGTVNGFFSDPVVFTASSTISVPCYAKGTLILTDKGYIKIEDIKKGDKVVREGSISKKGVLEKNKINEVPVTWVSKFKIETLDSLSRPICIEKNAFGEDRPFENLYVSPGHSIMIDDRLITAKNLRNGDTVYPHDECESVEYYHLQCEAHSAIYANGVLSETYIEWRKEFFDVINYLQ